MRLGRRQRLDSRIRIWAEGGDTHFAFPLFPGGKLSPTIGLSWQLKYTLLSCTPEGAEVPDLSLNSYSLPGYTHGVVRNENIELSPGEMIPWAELDEESGEWVEGEARTEDVFLPGKPLPQPDSYTRKKGYADLLVKFAEEVPVPWWIGSIKLP